MGLCFGIIKNKKLLYSYTQLHTRKNQKRRWDWML